MSDIDSNIPFAMGAGHMDTSIPLAADSRAALNVKPFAPIDAAAAESKMLDLQSQRATVQDQMRERAEKQVDEYTIKNYLKDGGDLYTTEGYEKAIKDLKGKVSLPTYQNLSKAAASKKENDLKIQHAASQLNDDDFKMVRSKTESVVEMMGGPVAAYDKVLQDTGDEAKATEAFNAAKAAAIAQAAQMTGSDGKPLYPPQLLQQFEKAGPEVVKGRLMQSKGHLDLLTKTAEIKLKEAQTKAAEALAKTRKDGKELTSLKAIEEAEQNGDISPEDAKKLRDKMTAGPGSKPQAKPTLSPEAIDLMAHRVAQGDAKALQNIGRGTQGEANLTAINNRVAELGLSATDMQRASATVAAAGAGLKAVAQRAAKLDAAAIEVDKFADNAMGSLAKVTRGNIVPVNEIMRKVSLGTGSPEEAEFATYVQSLVGAYATVIGRGTPTVHSQEEASKVIRTDYSPEQFKAMVGALKKEARAVVDSSKEAGEGIADNSFKDAKPKGEHAKVSPEEQKKRDADRPAILRSELAKAKDRLAKATDPDEKTRAQGDIDATTKELKALGVTADAPASAASLDKLAEKFSKVTSDADYEALPSGAVFIGPDGKRRRKP